GRPGGKASLQSLRVQQAKNLAQSLRRRDAAGERQKGAQPVQRPGRDLLYTLPVVRSAHDANQRRQQHLVQGIGDPFPESGGPTQPAYDPETQATWRGPPSFSNPTWLISRYRFRTLPWAMPPVAVKTRYRSSETGVSRGISGSVRHSGVNRSRPIGSMTECGRRLPSPFRGQRRTGWRQVASAGSQRRGRPVLLRR